MNLLLIRAECLLSVLMLVFATPSGSAQQSRCDCTGLHAGITAELTKGYSEPSVMLNFLLLNDSQKKLKATPESWKIVIDGKELEDSGMIFGNGPMPTHGYATLAPSATFQFGKALSIPRYFPKPREYKISWKAENFQSPTVHITIPSQHL